MQFNPNLTELEKRDEVIKILRHLTHGVVIFTQPHFFSNEYVTDIRYAPPRNSNVELVYELQSLLNIKRTILHDAKTITLFKQKQCLDDMVSSSAVRNAGLLIHAILAVDKKVNAGNPYANVTIKNWNEIIDEPEFDKHMLLIL